MSRLQVDLDALRLLADRMDGLRAELAHSHDLRRSPVDPRIPRIDAALSHFEDQWGQGMAMIRNALEEDATRLRTAASTYQHTDACVEQGVVPAPVIIP